MARSLLIALILLLSFDGKANNQTLLQELDRALSMRQQFDASKEKRIETLKAENRQASEPLQQLALYDKIYQEYYVYKLDSALTYANKGYELAVRAKDTHYQNLFALHRALSLSIGGLYTEALETLNAIHIDGSDHKLLFLYYSTLKTLYLYKAAFCNDRQFQPIYQRMGEEYLLKAMQHLSPKDAPYGQCLSEKYLVIDKDLKKAKAQHLAVIKEIKENTREYAQTCFSLANTYQLLGDNERYEEYLIRSSIADIKNSTKENTALRNLAVYLYEQGDEHLERAEQYINTSMDDAKFFDNRLRILENSQILPQIMKKYQEKVKRQNTSLLHFALFSCLLLACLFVATYYIYRQNKKLNNRKQQLADSNKKLNEANAQLVGINKRRENLALIYIDLCAKYIDKLVKYQTLVKRKIKANQTAELLTMMSSAHVSEDDANTFLSRFDKAFLDLYPSFVEGFNNLLHPEARFTLKIPNTLCTELRIFALIRLGVGNTTDIARLLFLSNQRIYNCRSVVKGRAICKETFEEDVMKIG